MSTLGRSKLVEKSIHHTFWYYKRFRNGSLLDHIRCDEHKSSYSCSDSFKYEHPEEKYIIIKNIIHLGSSKKRRK